MKTSHRFWVFLLLALGSFAIPAIGAPGHSAEAERAALDTNLAEEILKASGITEEARRHAYEATLQSWLQQMQAALGARGSEYRKAKRLHLELHARILRRYDPTADGLDAVLERGEYNCLSASLLVGLMARAFGWEAQVVEIPSHVYVRLFIEQRRIEVESTSRDGFDLHPRLEARSDSGSEPGYLSNAGPVLTVPEVAAPDGVELEQAVGFLWHNRGRRALDRGEALVAARAFLEESRLEPPGSSRSESLGMYLARAFRLTYEAGGFEDAYRIAEIGVRIFPGETTARDRLLAAALKQVEVECDLGRLEQAEGRLEQAAAAVGNPADVGRLERGACPLIAAAAVRGQDWIRAARMARRFAIAETDPVEGDHLMRWVIRRAKEARDARNACTDPLLRWAGDGEALLEAPLRSGVEPGSSAVAATAD